MNGQTAAVTHQHPAIIQAGGKLDKAAKRVELRHKTGALAIGDEIATAGVCIDIENILDLAGYFDKNRPQPMTILQFAKLVLRVWPNIIPAALNKSRFGELTEAYNASLSGGLKNIDMKGWGNGATAEMFVSLATAYKAHQSMPELEVVQVIQAYKPAPTPEQVYREAVAYRVDALAVCLEALPKDAKIGRADLLPAIGFGFGYDVLTAAGIIAPGTPEKLAAVEKAEMLLKSEAANKTRESEQRQGASFTAGAFNGIVAAFVANAQDAIKSTAKDLIFLDAVNSETFDRPATAKLLRAKKQEITETETARLLAASTPKQ
jgi:hypothetical protein